MAMMPHITLQKIYETFKYEAENLKIFELKFKYEE